VPSSNLCKRIACAAPACGILRQNAALNKIIDIAQRRVLREFGEHGPFGGGELAFKPIEYSIDDSALPIIRGCAGMYLPKARLREQGRQYRLGATESGPDNRETIPAKT
jgi:hypothetical protein